MMAVGALNALAGGCSDLRDMEVGVPRDFRTTAPRLGFAFTVWTAGCRVPPETFRGTKKLCTLLPQRDCFRCARNSPLQTAEDNRGAQKSRVGLPPLPDGPGSGLFHGNGHDPRQNPAHGCAPKRLRGPARAISPRPWPGMVFRICWNHEYVV